MRQELHDARALAIMECADSGLSPVETRVKLDLTYKTVRKYAERYGIKFKENTPIRNPKAPKRDLPKLMRECAESGLTRAETAEKTGLHYSLVCQIARAHQVVFSKTYRISDEDHKRIEDRAAIMAALYTNGYTLNQIGEQFGMTRERVRQILSKRRGFNWQSGGAHFLAEKNAARKAASMDAKCFKRWGCTYVQWQELVKIGKEMRRAGKSHSTTPTGGWCSQRSNSRKRGIPFELSLWQWWTIWQSSGKWEERGRGQGYVMCRIGDEGPYAVGNVYIDTAVHNCSSAPRKRKHDLPTGVSKVEKGNYVAYVASRQRYGVMKHLGSFKTPELAHAAYLMAGAA